MAGFSTPLLVRDTVAVCAAPPLPEDVRIKFRRRVPLKLALNTVRFDLHAGQGKPGWLEHATRMGAPKTLTLTVILTLTLTLTITLTLI